EGLILPFLGRKTTIPTGAFQLAGRFQARLIPCFTVHRGGPYHDIFIGEAIECPDKEDDQAGFARAVQHYLAILEDFIERFPREWLWGSKRWKYCWTKRLVILSDGKAGHVKQSMALAERFQSLQTQYGRPGMEYLIKIIDVQFRTPWRKRLFSWFAFFFIPWAQGRLHWLKFFLMDETLKELAATPADFVISAGSSLVALNLCLARESRAKSVVLMKPSFPYNLFRYDLAVIGLHDGGIIPQEAFRTLLAPGSIDGEDLEKASQVIQKGLRDPAHVKIAVFIGGPTRRYRLHLGDIEKLIMVLEHLSKSYGDYLLTTSRRTPESIVRFLKSKEPYLTSCQMLVIAREDPRPEVVPGMMGLADVLIVTEDSISMISEAVRSAKKVIVLELGSQELPEKHRRFKQILQKQSAVVLAGLDDLEEKIRWIRKQEVSKVIESEELALIGRLQEIL
ncbi:MAG: mitochondrial fission ELM1 family protein, partial [Candidatus Omnitrophica bacterium]|nr:mitochondrial fission ELM1 family protein [Candidatus Omnitrophota bacterium]